VLKNIISDISQIYNRNHDICDSNRIMSSLTAKVKCPFQRGDANEGGNIMLDYYI
jgi:hypothetical protein